jgi:serine/threonine protein kinase
MATKNSLESTRLATTTESDLSVCPEAESTVALERGQLIENYKGIIGTGAIHHPVTYEFLHELGRGRQGQVYLALRRGARGCVTRHAIKLFDPGIYASSEKYRTDMGRIATQVSLLQSSHNPNLLQRDAYEEVLGIGYVQMEAIDGIDLRFLLDGKHVDRVLQIITRTEYDRLTGSLFRLGNRQVEIQLGLAVHIMRQMLRGLEALHGKDFVHSDIKPSNIMIDRLGYVRVIDHGRGVKHAEKVRILLGSPIYMAPEAHQRMPSVTQSDLYSVGLVGLEMLRGEPLVADANIGEKELLKIKLKLPRALPDLLPKNVRENEAFVNVLSRLLHPDPAARQPSAEDADSGSDGLSGVHREHARTGDDAEYPRELEDYLEMFVDPTTDRIVKG